MGKRSQKNKNPKKSNSKFTLIGIAVVIVIVGVIILTTDPDAIKADSPNPAKVSFDTQSGSPVLGEESAPVTIVEFGDYQCPFCKRWNETVKPSIEEEFIKTGVAKLVFVDFTIVGSDSLTVHSGSYCAAEQDLYWEYHDFIYANQGHENDGWAKAENLKKLVGEMNDIDSDMFNECLDSKKYEQLVAKNTNIARDAGARSTPSFVVIGPDGSAESITGAQPYSTFKTVIEKMT